MTEVQLAEWYREVYFPQPAKMSSRARDGIYQHTYDHDYEVALKRLAAYKLPEGIKLLDVGAGNGAFVNAAVTHGKLDAWGQDLAQQSDGPRIYAEALAEVAFPTDDFDVITIHDVLEHIPDPIAMLKEIRRILKPGGKLIVDFPRFWHESGRHHWKPVEHLWCLDEQQLNHLLRQAGFLVTHWDHPIESKIVMVAEATQQTRPQILVPAGIGDSYWVLVKLPGFLKAHGLEMPDLWVQDMGPKRTEPFLKTVPFVHSAGYKVSHRDRIFHEAYMTDGRTVFPGVLGVDYFIAYNGILRAGKSLAEVDPQYGCDWYPKIHVSKEAQEFQAKLEAGGPYAVCFFTLSGMYTNWLNEFGPEGIFTSCVKINKELGLRIVMVGAEWDKNSLGDQMAYRAQSNSDWVNLISQTSFDQLLGAILGASLIYGWPAGNTLLGPVLNIPTALVWNRYFRSAMWTNTAPPDSPYVALDTAGLTPEIVVDQARKVMGR